MKRRIVWTIAFAFLTLGLAASASAQGLHPCSIARVAGDWGYSLQGTFLVPPSGTAVPVSFVGTLNVDWRGHVFGKQTSNAGGAVTKDVLVGTITVNTDCTGTFVVDIFDESGATLRRSAVWALVFVNNAREMRGTFESLIAKPSNTPVPAIAIANGKKLAGANSQED
jgi:hypothetical protein